MDYLCTPHLAPSPFAILIMSRTTVTWPAITYFPGPFPILMSYFGRNADIEPDTRADRLLEAADRMRGSRGEVAEGLVRSERIFDLRVRSWLTFDICTIIAFNWTPTGWQRLTRQALLCTLSYGAMIRYFLLYLIAPCFPSPINEKYLNY